MAKANAAVKFADEKYLKNYGPSRFVALKIAGAAALLLPLGARLHTENYRWAWLHPPPHPPFAPLRPIHRGSYYSRPRPHSPGNRRQR